MRINIAYLCLLIFTRWYFYDFVPLQDVPASKRKMGIRCSRFNQLFFYDLHLTAKHQHVRPLCSCCCVTSVCNSGFSLFCIYNIGCAHTHTHTHVLSVWRRHVHVESLVAHLTPSLAGARAGAGARAEAGQERWLGVNYDLLKPQTSRTTTNKIPHTHTHAEGLLQHLRAL